MATIYERAYRMTDHHSTITTLVSYLTSFTLILGSALDFLNNNALAFGVVFGGITCWTNYRAKRTLVNYYQDTSIKKRREDLDSDL